MRILAVITECFSDPMVRKSFCVDVQLLNTTKKIIRNIELEILKHCSTTQSDHPALA
ncbi:hypothetical protein ES703_55945 [subsurface metagenome]